MQQGQTAVLTVHVPIKQPYSWDLECLDDLQVLSVPITQQSEHRCFTLPT